MKLSPTKYRKMLKFLISSIFPTFLLTHAQIIGEAPMLIMPRDVGHMTRITSENSLSNQNFDSTSSSVLTTTGSLGAPSELSVRCDPEGPDSAQECLKIFCELEKELAEKYGAIITISVSIGGSPVQNACAHTVATTALVEEEIFTSTSPVVVTTISILGSTTSKPKFSTTSAAPTTTTVTSSSIPEVTTAAALIISATTQVTGVPIEPCDQDRIEDIVNQFNCSKVKELTTAAPEFITPIDDNLNDETSDTSEGGDFSGENIFDIEISGSGENDFSGSGNTPTDFVDVEFSTQVTVTFESDEPETEPEAEYAGTDFYIKFGYFTEQELATCNSKYLIASARGGSTPLLSSFESLLCQHILPIHKPDKYPIENLNFIPFGDGNQTAQYDISFCQKRVCDRVYTQAYGLNDKQVLLDSLDRKCKEVLETDYEILVESKISYTFCMSDPEPEPETTEEPERETEPETEPEIIIDPENSGESSGDLVTENPFDEINFSTMIADITEENFEGSSDQEDLGTTIDTSPEQTTTKKVEDGEESTEDSKSITTTTTVG